MRILHLPVVSGRQAWGLSRAERELGHESDFVAFENTFGRLPCDMQLFGVDDGLFVQELKRWKFFLQSIFKYDIFHFHFGQKFFVLNPRPVKAGDSFVTGVARLIYWFYSQIVGRLDLILLRLLGKKMFLTYHGDDIRQGDRSRELFENHFVREVLPGYYDDYSDERKRRNALIFERYCEQLYVVSPDLVPMAPKSAKLILHTGVDPREWVVPTTPVFEKQKPLIVHAPSNREVKGTKYIEASVLRLKNRGYEFDFQVVENTSNDEARRTYERADLVIDQLFLGWYGAFALECMALGKPVICYIRTEDTKHMPVALQAENPAISATPETLDEVLVWCLENPEKMREIGARSRTFVERWYQPTSIARDVILRYQCLDVFS